MIKYRHYRALDYNILSDASGLDAIGTISCRGGATLAYTEDVDKDGKKFFAGSVAWCNPKDNYNRKYGRAKSSGFLKQNAQAGYKYTDDLRHFVRYDVTNATEFLQSMDEEMMLAAGYEPR